MSAGGGGGQFPQYGQQPNYGSRMGAGMNYGGGNSVNYQPRGGGFQADPGVSTMNQRFPVNRYQAPQQGFGPQGFTGNEWMGGQQQPMGNSFAFSQAPQMSDEYRRSDPQTQPVQAGDSAPGFSVNQRMAPPQSNSTQSFEQFASTLGDSGMTSGQMQDAYQKSIQPQSTNFWGNVGPGGTQNPYPGAGAQPFNPAWGNQTFGFDPRAMAGKQVTGDLGWYYGRDAIGRNINNAGDAVPSFGAPADGFQRRRPWMG